MTSAQLRERTQRFALDTIRFVRHWRNERTLDIIARQLIRSATSVGANYRAACRARSAAEFVAKMGIVEEEADETVYWLELVSELDAQLRPSAQPLRAEAGELLAITIASIRTARQRPRN